MGAPAPAPAPARLWSSRKVDAALLAALLLVLALQLLLVELELLHLLPERLRLGLGAFVRGVDLQEFVLVPLRRRLALGSDPPRGQFLDEKRLLAPVVDAVERGGHDRGRVVPAEGVGDLVAGARGEYLRAEGAVKIVYAQLCFRAVGAGGAPEYPSPRGPARGTSRTLPTHTSFSRRRSLRIASAWGARRQSSARQKGAGGGRKKGGSKDVVVARALTEPVAASRDVHVALADGLQARVARVLEVRHGR